MSPAVCSYQLQTSCRCANMGPILCENLLKSEKKFPYRTTKKSAAATAHLCATAFLKWLLNSKSWLLKKCHTKKKWAKLTGSVFCVFLKELLLIAQFNSDAKNCLTKKMCKKTNQFHFARFLKELIICRSSWCLNFTKNAQNKTGFIFGVFFFY